MIRELIGRWLMPDLDMGAAGPIYGGIDWIDGPDDDDDDENAAEGFNEPTESEPEDDEEE